MIDSHAKLSEDIKKALKPYKNQVKRPAMGSLLYDYVVPAGVYEEMFDWDAFFVGMAISSDLSSEAVYLRNVALNYIINSEQDGFTPGAFGPRGRDIEINHIKPFIAQTAFFASKYLANYEWIKPYFDQLKKIVLYRESHLWDKKRDLGVWFDACESGVDNNIAALEFPNKTVVGVDCNTYIYREYRALSYIAREIDKKKDAEFFLKRAEIIKKNINKHLWDDTDKSYYNIDTRDGSFIKRMAFTNFLPLWERMASPKNAQLTIEKYLINPKEMWSEYGIRSLSKTDKGYNNVNMIKPFSNWQGPIWPIANYLSMQCLLNYGYQKEAIEAAERITRLVLKGIKENGGMHENYDAETGEPLAAPNFISWNLLLSNMLDEAIRNKQPFDLTHEYRKPSEFFSLLSNKELKETSEVFAKEIENKRKGKSSSLSALIHPIHSLLTKANKGVALVANGMLGKSAEWERIGDKIQLKNKGMFTLPSLTYKEEYFRLISQKIEDTNIKNIGVNIAFALEPKVNGVIDGKLIRFAKEHYIKGLKGRYVGKELQAYLKINKKISANVGAANDIVCLLLSGLRDSKSSKHLIAGIVGDGSNMSFLDSLQKWDTSAKSADTLAAINLESANFNKFKMSEAVKAIDVESEYPGKALSEKEISSNYLFLLYNLLMKKQFGHKAELISNTNHLNRIASNEKYKGFKLANDLLERSAQLVAVQLAGILIYMKNTSGNVSLIMDGDLFWTGYKYKNRVTKWLQVILPNVSVQFKKIDDSDLLGAAILSLIVKE